MGKILLPCWPVGSEVGRNRQHEDQEGGAARAQLEHVRSLGLRAPPAPPKAEPEQKGGGENARCGALLRDSGRSSACWVRHVPGLDNGGRGRLDKEGLNWC